MTNTDNDLVEPYDEMEIGDTITLVSNYWEGNQVRIRVTAEPRPNIPGTFHRNVTEQIFNDEAVNFIGMALADDSTVYCLGDHERIIVAFSRLAAQIGAVHPVMVSDCTF